MRVSSWPEAPRGTPSGSLIRTFSASGSRYSGSSIISVEREKHRVPGTAPHAIHCVLLKHVNFTSIANCQREGLSTAATSPAPYCNIAMQRVVSYTLNGLPLPTCTCPLHRVSRLRTDNTNEISGILPAILTITITPSLRMRIIPIINHQSVLAIKVTERRLMIVYNWPGHSGPLFL